MVECHYDHTPPFQDLHQWLENSQSKSRGGAWQEYTKPFLPDTKLGEYFQDSPRVQRLLRVVFRDEEIPVEPQQIRQSHGKVFLILVLIGKGRFIRHFLRYDDLSDQHLPFTASRSHFPKSDAGRDFFEIFYDKQWEFCAPKFADNMDREFDSEIILPIIGKEKLAEGGSATTYKIALHPAYDDLKRKRRELSSIDRHPHTYVLKTYNVNTKSAADYYSAEVANFRKLRIEGNSSFLVQYHGSFTQDGAYNILLEYADKGTLEDVFEKITPPSRPEDIIKFWSSMYQILSALDLIHNVSPHEFSGPHYFRGCHQDVKPANILVMSGEDGSAFDFVFKLGDLGLSHFTKTFLPRTSTTGKDTHGTRTYGAPECYRINDDFQRHPRQVDSSVDIWSLGCMFSEAAVWVVHGWDGLQEYRRRRQEETAENTEFRDDDCFHDGVRPLHVVLDLHQDLPQHIRPHDYVTGPTVERLIKLMLDDPAGRPSARNLYHYSMQILAAAKRKFDTFNQAQSNAGSARKGAHTSLKPTSHSTAPYMQDPGTERMSLAHTIPRDNNSWNPAPSNHLNPSAQQEEGSNTTGYRDRLYIDVENQGQKLDLRPQSLADDRILLSPQRSKASGVDKQCNVSESPTMFGDGFLADHDARQSFAFTNSPPEMSRSNTLAKTRSTHNGFPRGPIATGMSQTGSLPAELPNNTSDRSKQAQKQAPPSLSVKAAERWKRNRKKSSLPDGYLIETLNKRDHVFLIDDSSSMKCHSKAVQRLVGILAYMVKDSDPDGIDLYFTISSDKYKSRHTTHLTNVLGNKKYEGHSNVRCSLMEIVQGYKDRLKQPVKTSRFRSIFGQAAKPVRTLNVYVLTDGIWQPDCDPTEIIETLIGDLKDHATFKEQFGIQFISFGKDPHGLATLNHLDSGLNLPMDIVDTEPSDGNVWKMLLGAINKWFDNDSSVDISGNGGSPTPTPTTAGSTNTAEYGRGAIN